MCAMSYYGRLFIWLSMQARQEQVLHCNCSRKWCGEETTSRCHRTACQCNRTVNLRGGALGSRGLAGPVPFLLLDGLSWCSQASGQVLAIAVHGAELAELLQAGFQLTFGGGANWWSPSTGFLRSLGVRRNVRCGAIHVHTLASRKGCHMKGSLQLHLMHQPLASMLQAVDYRLDAGSSQGGSCHTPDRVV